MPKTTSSDRVQVSFPADREIEEQLKAYAKANDLSMAHIHRQAAKLRLAVILRERKLRAGK